MQNINETLRKLANNPDFNKRYEAQKNEVLSDPWIQDFFKRNEGEISREMIDKSLMKLHEFSTQSKACRDCKSLDSCTNMIPGYEPILVLSGSYIDVSYDRCPKKVMYDESQKNERLIESMFVPKEILKASFADIEIEKGRFKAIKMAKEFVELYKPGERQKGLYLHGPFGTGKSFLLGAIAGELAKKHVGSLLIYAPELFREMKNSIGDHSVGDKLDAIKKAPVLMLDDIGAETMSGWIRDDILGPILQFRMMENLPTLFSSNFDLDGLEHHLAHSQRGGEEQLKAARILERIKYLAEPVKVEGKNRRV
ncbi:primosomal protein DnaI [Mesobacillus zeae]|uniref:Primosomal protein DnaI n=1 Tax=Mesobacillus zeae TaxID=1917180 RepID=A0A398B1I4_9BACI|nr:primosomal protein DnaI [Mesobacillus zeae]RID83184.1 primosomal protein DnaI [Mesobacillus zeae]